jgi:signal transduction histidine kinase
MSKLASHAEPWPLSVVRVNRLDGTSFVAEVMAQPLPVEGEPHQLVIFRDITERIQLEEERARLNEALEKRVEERTLALQQANEELASFSYTVSHDLRGPLRSIDGWTYALEQTLSSNDLEGRECTDHIRASVKRMACLIDDLLGLAGISQRGLNPKLLDLSAMAEDIVEELRDEGQERNVEVVIQPGLTAVGDERLIHLALRNLIENAWKFTNRTAKPRVEIGASNNHYFVRDNGAGFSNDHKSNLFLPFGRLHSERDYPGTGIGLATVQRIISRHGGSIEATGKVGEGAEFRFTLPTKQEP